MGMKYKDPVTGQLKELSLKAADTLPIGTIVDYDGQDVPEGWEEYGTDDYSTEETFTGKHWIDGKPIYRKVITGNTGVLNNVSKYNISDNVNICTRIEGFIIDGSNNLIPINYSNSGALVWAYITAERKLGIQSNVTYFDNYQFYAVIEYTKTTD